MRRSYRAKRAEEKAEAQAAEREVRADAYRFVDDRDEQCRWCGGPIEHHHHVEYRSQGGQDVPENLICLCERCHRMVHSNKRFYEPKLRMLLRMPPRMLGRLAFADELRNRPNRDRY